jgi:hypothetical protein
MRVRDNSRHPKQEVLAVNAYVLLISALASVVLALGGSSTFAQSSGPSTLPKRTLTLDSANAMVAAAIAHAKMLGIPSTVAVYDDTEILKALRRRTWSNTRFSVATPCGTLPGATTARERTSTASSTPTTAGSWRFASRVVSKLTRVMRRDEGRGLGCRLPQAGHPYALQPAASRKGSPDRDHSRVDAAERAARRLRFPHR